MTPLVISLVMMFIGYGIVGFTVNRFFRDEGEEPPSILLMFFGSILGSMSGLFFIIFLVHYLFF